MRPFAETATAATDSVNDQLDRVKKKLAETLKLFNEKPSVKSEELLEQVSRFLQLYKVRAGAAGCSRTRAHPPHSHAPTRSRTPARARTQKAEADVARWKEAEEKAAKRAAAKAARAKGAAGGDRDADGSDNLVDHVYGTLRRGAAADIVKQFKERRDMARTAEGGGGTAGESPLRTLVRVCERVCAPDQCVLTLLRVAQPPCRASWRACWRGGDRRLARCGAPEGPGRTRGERGPLSRASWRRRWRSAATSSV